MQNKDNKKDVNDDIINIAVTVDDNYIKPLIVMLVSLFNSNWNSKFNIFLIHSDLSDDNLNKVSNLFKLYGQVINIIKLDQSLFEKATSVEHVTKETFYRLLLTEIIPKDIDKILYLDPDIIINGPITKLYNKKFNNKLAIAAEVAADNSRWNNQKRLIGIPIKATYFNAGVLLFNLKLMRKSPIFTKEFMLDYVIKNNKRFIEGDQSCLNALLWDKVIVLNCNIYNYDTRFYYDAHRNNFIKFLISNIREQNLASRKSIIIHYRGASKPWQGNYYGKLWNIYWHYEHMTEYKRSFSTNYVRYKYNNLREIILILKKIYF
jgi:lipopolysaccharide biosynthesis glycosyltransferase